ncbi:MAG: penicillin-binding protein [Candidatus Kerfeldbacteria bacterium]|nr:penicillin-binding protein [Candidatus Kerfeldbacteria bacterium]
MPIPSLQQPNFRIRKIGQRVSQISGAAHEKRSSAQRPRPKGWKKKLTRYGLPGLGILIVLAVIGGVAAFAWVSRDLPDPDKVIDRSVAQSTKIYARDETTLLYEIHGDVQRTLIQIKDVPDIMKQATIAIEDNDFYNHKGFDLPGIAKAVCHEVVGNLGGLCPQRGGSTITQQFVKNAILTDERSYTRKLKELILAYQLEQNFTKDQILQMYFNEIPFGSTRYGVEAAAQSFFGKSVRDVTLAEAAFLAAIPNRPTYYSPYGNNVDALSVRIHLVLDTMVEQGYITKEQADEAKTINLLEKLRPPYENIRAPHFVLWVREQLADKYGETVVEQGGLKVITTLNIDKQQVAEEVIEKYAPKNAERYNASNAALVNIETKTGQILAMVGSKDYFDESIDGQVNVALRPRQPGSSFKPLVYASAFAKGYTDNTILFDLVTKFKTDGPDYEPKDYDLGERGPLTMRKALAGSLNIPAVKTLYLAGIDTVLENAQKLGYTTLGDRSRFGLSLVLGGGEVTLLEHTAAFATFAREGIYHPPTGILRVEDPQGKILEQYEERSEEVFDAKALRLLNDVLSDDSSRAYIFGAGGYLTLPGRPVAAKTGTTNDYRDAWTMGYTPSYATGVWVGNNDNSEMRRGADGSIVAAPIWHEFMKRTVGGPAEPFQRPAADPVSKPVLRGELEGGTTILVDSITGNRIPDECKDAYPKKFIAEKTVRIAHTILHYVNKDDPRGPVPNNPSADPQYQRWEEPIRRWAEKNNYLETLPALEDCKIHDPDRAPEISITAPITGDTVDQAALSVTVSVSAPKPRKITKVEYSFDGTAMPTATRSPFSLEYTIPKGTVVGFHDITATVYDDVGNSASTTTTINYLPTPATNVNSAP